MEEEIIKIVSWEIRKGISPKGKEHARLYGFDAEGNSYYLQYKDLDFNFVDLVIICESK